MYLTGDESLTSRDWLDAHVRSRGALGALYPMTTWTAPNPHGTMKEGDTPSWFFFLPLGGNDPADPSKPGWGGQFVRQRRWLVSRSAGASGEGSARVGEPVAAGLSAGLRDAHGVVPAGREVVYVGFTAKGMAVPSGRRQVVWNSRS